MYEYTFDGNSAQKQKDYRDVFELIYDNDDDIYFQTKKTYLHEEEGLNFKYKYLVSCHYREFEDENDNNHLLQLSMIVDEFSLADEVKEYILGGDEYEITNVDIFENTFPIPFGYEEIRLEFKEWLEQPLLIDKLNTISVLMDMFDGIRGFWLDRVWNGIGSTGWDSIKYCIFNIDPIKAALERHDVA